jgi:type IV secretory pathway VirB3-like protein
MLTAIEVWALKVGLKINLKKTEFLLVGNWNEAVTLHLSSGAIAQVDDFKFLGSWLMNCQKNFEVRKTLAWKATTKLVRMWKQKRVSRRLKPNLFLACVETILLYNATTWTRTKTLTKRLDGCYTRLLRYALGYQ